MTEIQCSVTASYVLHAERYVRHGAFNDHSPEWGETFTALGGVQCLIQPAWVFGEPVGGIYMTVTGTPEAIAFVDNTLA
jgi:hypothetical protein